MRGAPERSEERQEGRRSSREVIGRDNELPGGEKSSMKVGGERRRERATGSTKEAGTSSREVKGGGNELQGVRRRSEELQKSEEALRWAPGRCEDGEMSSGELNGDGNVHFRTL